MRRRLRRRWGWFLGRGHGHEAGPPPEGSPRPRLAIVGSPNVGKSVIFNLLTGAYVTVSNYPGTTVEVARGVMRWGKREVEVIDTPGLYSLTPLSEEERVAQRILLREAPDLILHIVDAKNLERMLPLTLQLKELGRPMILVVNLLDEAQRVGVEMDLPALEQRLSIPVVGMIAVRKVGLKELKERIHAFFDAKFD